MAQSFEHIVDSKLREKPSMKELKRIILIALRCVDPDVENRPKMGDIIHMLEPRDLLLNDVRTTNYHFLRLTRYLKRVSTPYLLTLYSFNFLKVINFAITISFLKLK